MMSWLRNNKHLVCFRFDARRAGKIFGGVSFAYTESRGTGAEGQGGKLPPQLCVSMRWICLCPLHFGYHYIGISTPPPR